MVKYNIPSTCSNRLQREKGPLSGSTRLIQLSYADDIVVISKSIAELQNMLNIFNDEFNRFGITISTSKTKTMSFNVSSDVSSQPSLVKLDTTEIENVKQFTYLGHTISNQNTQQETFLSHRIKSAYKKWNELRSVFTDKRILLCTRVKFLTASIRSRLTFSVQTGLLNSHNQTKLESIWTNFLRKLVRNGFKRINAPTRKTKKETPNNEEDPINWKFWLKRQDILNITRTEPLTKYCHIQHLKFIAHVTRLPNTALQKQILFQNNRKKFARDIWKNYEKITGMTKNQLQMEMQERSRFAPLLEEILGTQTVETMERGKR